MGLTVSVAHYKRLNDLRVNDVLFHLMTRPERLYAKQKFEPDPGVVWDLSRIPKEKNRFNSVEDALAAINRWCG